MKIVPPCFIALMIVGLLAFGSSPCLADPAPAQTKDGRQAATPEEEAKIEGTDVSFMDSTRAQWYLQAINAQLYYPGQTLNSVFSERDKGRLENNLDLYKPSDTIRVVESSKTTAPDAKPEPVKLKLNGKMVEVSE